ncbi:hypothetical protein F8M41_005324 [Gigaspora margarita]|uniref:F-box domain-containing protein n=1 Tax=Gigaspora margarita TaxID=4874 RepID=A0A8H4AXK5_GIGMA|nr:hypothetical protein F8M41_005324 [Gigaspora margarita]
MASKILMGDILELVENILNNLNNEIYSLHSCALVSRNWCKLSIPLLWQNPFSIDQSSSFISQYFSSLDENEKIILNEYGINIKFPNTLFNYAKFLKVLDLSKLEDKIRNWIDLQQVSMNKSLKCHIINLLFKLFVESGTILHKLDLYFYNYELKPEISYSLERNNQFFSQLHDLSLGGTILDFNIKSATTLLEILAKNTTSISVLNFEGFDFGSDSYSNSEPQLFHAFISIIKSQKQLRHFTVFGGNEFPIKFIISALESQKQSLQEVSMDYCTCTEEFNVLKDCKNLKILRISDCEHVKRLELSVNTLDITNFMIYSSNLVPILKNSGSLLQRLRLRADEDSIREESVLIETLASFCPNITYLNIAPIKFSAQLVDLIGNLQKLQSLTLGNEYMLEDEILFTQFAKTLPPTLQYLDLTYPTFTPYIHVLLNNSHARLKYLLINRFENKETIKALIEFCKRKRTLKYIGVNPRYLIDDIKKEVEGYVSLVPLGRIFVNC